MPKANTFATSEEATAFFEKLHEMINDPRAATWAQITDTNLEADTEWALLEAIQAYEHFFDCMMSAG